MPSSASSPLADSLLAQRRAFHAFLTARLGDPVEAEDLLQTSLARAIQISDTLQDEAKATAWFYRILRHTLIDHVRSRDAARRRETAWASESAALADDAADTERQICRCFEALLPTLKPRQAELLRAVELEGRGVSAVAALLGLSANHASVELHRARAQLRQKLVAFCGPCAGEACLDCECAPRESGA